MRTTLLDSQGLAETAPVLPGIQAVPLAPPESLAPSLSPHPLMRALGCSAGNDRVHFATPDPHLLRRGTDLVLAPQAELPHRLRTSCGLGVGAVAETEGLRPRRRSPDAKRRGEEHLADRGFPGDPQGKAAGKGRSAVPALPNGRRLI